MRKLFLILSFILSCVVLNARPAFRKYMVEEAGPGASLNVQGAAAFGNLLFQFYDGSPQISVYDLSSRKRIGEAVLEGHRTWHCNNASVSSFYYEKGDEFPLIYVSQENAAEHKVTVFRISRDGASSFTAAVVQTITLPEPEAMGLHYPNLALDVQRNRLYVTGYSAASWSRPEENSLQILCFPLPFPYDGTVELSVSDIAGRISLPFRTATQGAAVRNGKLYQAYGVPGMGPLSLCCTSLDGGKCEWELNLVACGFSNEPEGLFFHNDELMLVDVKKGVFSSGIKIPWEIPEKIVSTAPRLAAGSSKRLVCLDLDATITQHRTPLEKFNRDALRNLDNHFKVLMVCAGNAPRVWKQMGNYPIDILGNYGMQEARCIDGELKIVRQITIPADTAFFLEKTDYLRKKYGYTEYNGAPVEFHPAGMVTFGLLGTTAAAEQKVGFDPDRAKRRAMYPEVLEIFKDFSVYIGGSSSFDFAPRQFNKYDAVMDYARANGYRPDEVIFVGDDFDDGGGDSHVRIKGMDYIAIDDYHNFPVEVSVLFLSHSKK